MSTMSKYWSDFLQNLSPYVAGEQPQDKSYIKLNTNECPYPPSEAVLDAIRERVSDRLRLYPDPDANVLRQTIADYYGLQKQNIFTGNGSDEVLGFAFQAFFMGKAAISFADITYSFYPVYCRLFGIDYKTFALTDSFELDINRIAAGTGGIIIANPNAPTGRGLACDKIRTVLENNPDVVVVVDEAYVDFGGQSCIPLIQEYPNLLVVQTLSKSRSLAGLRVGLALGDSGLIDGIQRVKNSFNAYPLDSLALAGATAAFTDRANFEHNRSRIIATRTWTIVALEKLGFHIVPSEANFIMATHTTMPASSLYLTLKERGILVRYFNSPRIDNYLRITIGMDEEMQALVNTVEAIVSGETAVQ
jgi:histidinol-phosphate aminotransferase